MDVDERAVRSRIAWSDHDGIDSIMSPGSVAVVGASTRPGPGRKVVENLKRLEFPGVVHLVNTNGSTIDGMTPFASLSDIPAPPDLVVVAVNSVASVSVVSEAARIGCKGAVVLASGFGEIGTGGALLAERVLAEARGMSLIGPNCLGFVNVQGRVGAYSGPMVEQPGEGAVALVSNSGALACSLTGAAAERRIAFSHVITTGNQLDLGIAEFVRYLATCQDVRVIACYMEGFEDGRNLLKAFETASASGKTVVVLKSGRSRAGGEASRTHTGALAGSASVQAELFAGCDVLMAADPEEFLAMMELGERIGRPLTDVRFGAVTISGGERLLLADACEEAGLQLASLSDATVDAVRAVLPPYATPANPLDTTGAGIVEGRPEAHASAVRAVAEDPSVDVLLACQDAKNGWLEGEQSSDLFLDTITAAIAASEGASKPLVVMSPSTGVVDSRVRTVLSRHSVPCLMGLGPGSRALGKFVRADANDEVRRYPRSSDSAEAGTRLGAEAVISYLEARGISHWPTTFVRSLDEAVRAATTIGYPIAMKLESKIAHRRALGGVRIGLVSTEQVAAAWTELMQSARAHGFEVEEMSLQRLVFAEEELFLGAVVDDQFGPIVLLGPGGSDVEAQEKFLVGLAPLDQETAGELVERATSQWSLVARSSGERLEANVRDVVQKISRVICDPAVRAVDVNPLLVLRDGSVAIVDAKMVVASGG